MTIHIKQNKDYTKSEKKLFGFLHLNGIQVKKHLHYRL